jgi:DNA-binding NtrC family response regulator
MDGRSHDTAVRAVILVVEDEILVRMYAADILQEAGYHVIEAGNADEALLCLEARDDIQSVMTDIEMPGSMNGMALAAQIRIRWPEIGVLINSGRVRPASCDMPDGADFISKPYASSELLRRLQLAISRSS